VAVVVVGRAAVGASPSRCKYLCRLFMFGSVLGSVEPAVAFFLFLDVGTL
jgi:hypothetical protein